MALTWAVPTSVSADIARMYAAKPGTDVVAIDLSKVLGDIFDLSTAEGRARYLKGFTAIAWARKNGEVLIRGYVPQEAIIIIERLTGW